MPLHLNIRPGERLFINGAIIQNVKSRTADFTIENAARVLRESECIAADDANTLAGRVTLALQNLHLSADRQAQLTELTSLFHVMGEQMPEGLPVMRRIRAALASGNTYGALKMGRDLFEIENRTVQRSTRSDSHRDA
ncbi:flagellar biosynthesis repressor FlbT [Methylobacterium sp. UNC300MFChir4.1]|uniref:flagellar biosynthesis repressor FlbT n=1 Tax=Methylobacterium sp. UNC300MFChir4.1 TaxID=1502747 RepID=UPI000C20FDBF|nr:flagellar biosynthesis repressor FlbT [Methylobacterium sp. UNC300MFChir4.1]